MPRVQKVKKNAEKQQQQRPQILICIKKQKLKGELRLSFFIYQACQLIDDRLYRSLLLGCDDKPLIICIDQGRIPIGNKTFDEHLAKLGLHVFLHKPFHWPSAIYR